MQRNCSERNYEERCHQKIDFNPFQSLWLLAGFSAQTQSNMQNMTGKRRFFACRDSCLPVKC